MTELLIVANTPSPNTERLRDAVVYGANKTEIIVTVRSPLDAVAEDLLRCNGVIIGTTENFGYMSGLIKDFFERIYYPCLEQTQALPVALYVKAGNDGQGAKVSVERIMLGLRWKPVQEALIFSGAFDESFEQQCEMLGEAMAEGLQLGIF